jgi:hypothetical protein
MCFLAIHPKYFFHNFKNTAFNAFHKPWHIKCRNIGSPGSRDDDFGFWFWVQRFRVHGSGFKGKRFAGRLGGYKAEKLKSIRAAEVADFQASRPSSILASSLSKSRRPEASSQRPDT